MRSSLHSPISMTSEPDPMSRRAACSCGQLHLYLLDTQLRPSPIGLHAPLQHSASAAQAEPSALQATGRGSVDAVARPCWVKKAVTVRCEAAFCSSSHAAAGKTAMPTKSAKSIGKTACIRMITSIRHWIWHQPGSQLCQASQPARIRSQLPRSAALTHIKPPRRGSYRPRALRCY
jgi:hypothetical protein